jgi:uncharacterized membrane protein YccC
MSGVRARITHYLEQERLQPDINRGLRSVVAFMAPVFAVQYWSLPLEASFAAIAAQNIAMVDVRGSYSLRLSLLLAMTAVMAGAGWLGSMCASPLLLSLVAIAFVTLASGVWRHLSPDYGPPLAGASIFLVLLALAQPGGEAAALRDFLSVLVGGAWGVLVQVSLWPFRAQHPLRRSVSESWLALADLLAAMSPDAEGPASERAGRIAKNETRLRTTLDHTAAVLATQSGQRSAHARELEELNLAAARIATRMVAFNTALESLMEQPNFAALAPSFAPVFTSLTNTARTVAVTIVSHEPSHLATAEVRLRRLGNLLHALQDRVTSQTRAKVAGGQLVGMLKQVAQQASAARAALRATVERSRERAAFSLELFDVQTWTLKPLASALNFHWPPDAALVRFVLRLTVLQMLGVAVMEYFHLSRGYWLPLTVLVVLQPDYGSTRLRAMQRFVGTAGGGVVASLLLSLQLPPSALLAAMAVTMFGFAFWLKRNYAVAAFFITLFVVLITETAMRVTVAFTAERLLATAAGGALAMLAAHLFWPVWERKFLPGILARALRANREYLRRIGERLAAGGRYEGAVVQAKRTAEAANGLAFSSLQRMLGDPRNQQEGLEAAATLVNGNQRLTRALTVVALQLGPALDQPELKQFVILAGDTLEALARAAEMEQPDRTCFAKLRTALDEFAPPAVPGGRGHSTAPMLTDSARLAHSAATQFARCATELSAMLLASAPGESAPPGVAST